MKQEKHKKITVKQTFKQILDNLSQMIEKWKMLNTKHSSRALHIRL